MQRYRWPEFEIRLLGELQRQQNNAQFCDTLLQTEGISVPAHSCVLAALSPYLSQKLSASLSPPPSGQKLQLQLQAVKAQTLLKLVGLLYSGELEVKGSIEQNDVLSAAFQFGITGLLEGQKDGGMKEGELQKKSFGSCRERNESRTMQDAQVQAEMAGRRETGFPIEKRSYVSTATQTVKAGEKTVGRSFTHSGQNKLPTPEPASSLSQSLDFFTSLQPQNITHEKHVCSTSFPPIPCIPSGAPSDGASTLDRSSDSVINPNSALSSIAVTFPVSLDAESNSLTPQEDSTYQRPSGFGDSAQALAKEGTGLEDGKMADNRENGEQPSHANRDEMLGEEKGNSTEKRHVHANVGMKSLAKMKQMQQMMETTQISIKVKLRRRTKGEVWEVVSVQDTDETLSLLTSRKQDDSNHKRPQTDLTNGEPPPSSVQPGPVHKPILQPATTNSPEPPPHPNTTSDFNQNDGLESFLLPQPPGPAEESDEQIEKLLEDIMMGLNILTNLEGDCKKSHHQPSHDGAPSVCQVPVQENDRAQSLIHAAVSAEGCVCYQDFGTQIGHPSTDTAQNQPSCSSLSSVQPDVVLIQRQLQQPSPQCHSSVTSMGQRDGTSHQDMPLSKSQNCPYPEAPTTKSVIPIAFFSSGQKLHYPVCQDSSAQDNQNILDFLLLTNGNEAQSLHSFSLPCMDDLRLPRCLSPLEPSTSAAKHQPSNSTNHSDKIQLQPSLHGRPWLTEIPGSLQFPLDAITHRENKRAFSPQDTNRSCWSKQRQLNPQNGGTWAESCTVKEVEERGTISSGHQNAAELKSDPRNVKENSKCKQGDAAAPKRRKRKRTNHPQASCSLLACQDVKVGDGTRSQINLSLCSVSLSSNNVLAKEREMATSSSNMSNRFVGNTSEPSPTITESRREKTRGPGDLNSDQTRIRTRGFLKKTQETPSNTSLDNASVLKPRARRVESVHKQEVPTPRRKRGRPPKTKLEKKSHNVESEQQIVNNLPKKEEEGEKTKRRCKKRGRNRSDVQAIPLKKTNNTYEAEADNDETIPPGNKHGTPKLPRMVTLKEFQKLIESRRSKTGRSKESQDKETNETARNVGEELTKETEMDKEITQPPNRDGIEESHVISSVTVDENHNQIFNKSTAEYNKPQPDDSSTSKETSLFGAQKSCDAGMSDTMKHIVDSSRPCCDAHLPQEDKMPSDHNLNPQTPERTDPPLLDAVGFSKSSGCNQEVEEEEEEEEEEVDVLLCSPDKVPQIRECDNGLDNMDITPEEEEEEDVSEIDVTG